MKNIAIAFCFGILPALFLSCKKTGADLNSFSYEKAAGIWVPYENVLENGSIQQGPFVFASRFGVYAESVQLTKDKTFTPVQWQNSANFNLKLDERGTYTYYPAEHKLTFDGLWHLEYRITKFSDGELWLRNQGVTYRFKKQL